MICALKVHPKMILHSFTAHHFVDSGSGDIFLIPKVVSKNEVGWDNSVSNLIIGANLYSVCLKFLNNQTDFTLKSQVARFFFFLLSVYG